MVLVYALLGMLCWGLAPLFGKLGLYSVNPVTALQLRTLIAATFVAAWIIGTQNFSGMLQVPRLFWVLIGIEAILATLLGDLAYFAALKKGNINDVTLILSSSPLVTMLLSWLFLGQTISNAQIVGSVLIIAGLFLIGLDLNYQ
ncbi:MAG: EamA family transporter [Bacillota bacterium]